MWVTLTGSLLGLLFGMRHALEPDHLTAVSTLLADSRDPRRGAWLGILWGLGHTVALFVVGVVLALLDAKMPARLADAFELAVAVMLIVLGLRNLRRAFRVDGAPTLHSHGDLEHTHATGTAHVHLGRFTFAHRSLLIGLVHGLAGSGALTALVLADLPSTASRLVYIALFGLGSVAGMALLSGLAGWPLERLGRSERASRTMVAVTGALSTVLGIAWGWPLVGRLF